MSDENMKRRIKINTADLTIGDVFYLSEQSDYTYRIAAQGPQIYAHTALNMGRIACQEHKDVWIDAPARTTVGEFAVGEQFLERYTEQDSRKFTVTAVGRGSSLVIPSNNEYEYRFPHEHECEEVSDDE